MTPGDKVRYCHEGRAYLAEISLLGKAIVYIRFIKKVPPDELGRRPRTRAIPLGDLVPYGRGGIDYKVQGVR